MVRPTNPFELDELKQTPILDVAARLGLRPARGTSMRCPFPGHDDRNPSFHFFVGTNTCHCFGCQRGGSVVDLIALSQQCSIGEAISWLRAYRRTGEHIRPRKLLNILPLKKKNVDADP